MEKQNYYVSQLNEKELIALFNLILEDCAMKIIRVHKKDRVGFIIDCIFQVVYDSPFSDSIQTAWFTLDDYCGWCEHDKSNEYESSNKYFMFLAKRFGKEYIAKLIEARFGLSPQFLAEIYNPSKPIKQQKNKIRNIFKKDTD